MTTAMDTPMDTATGAVRRRTAGWYRPLLLLTAAMAVLAVVFAVGVVADPRTVTGAPVWLKPFKFAVSFVLYSLTLAWMLSLLPQRGRLVARAAAVLVATSVIEMLIIAGQAARGRPSHFNDSTPLDAVLLQTMAVAVLVLFLAHLVVAVAALRSRLLRRTQAYALRLGLGLASLGMLAAVPMVLPTAAPGTPGVSGAHSVGVADGGPGLPVLGWSTVGGDLRVGHFVGLHGLQALPLLALLLDRWARRWSGQVRARLLLVAGAGYAGTTVLLTVQALRGQALLRPDAVTLAAAAVLVAGTVTAAVLVVARGRRTARPGALRPAAVPA